MGKNILQLQSILFPSSDVCDVEELYYHKNDSTNRCDFNGYFNLFYIEKRKKYTQIDNVSLKIQAVGYKTLFIVHNGVDIASITLESEQKKEYSIALPYSEYDEGAFWFSVTAENNTLERNLVGWYVSEVEEKHFREANICVDICTYKREEYILRNLSLLKETILEKHLLAVSSHLNVYVVDNGQTLHKNIFVQELVEQCHGTIKIISNKNTGGAGGFTRGMIESLKGAQFSHLLLMDDDAVIEPDCYVRIFALISTLKDEWKHMTIGGAMLRDDFPYILFCAGEWWENGKILNPNKNLDLRKLEIAASPMLMKPGAEFTRYSGWWCCCYSMEVIRENNLPIPLFIHHDDIEFGLRNCSQGIVFMNGICVWHKAAETIFPGSNIYYDMRNNLIEIALHQIKRPKLVAQIFLIKSMIAAIFRLKYRDIDLLQQAVKDFLKGPRWLVSQNAASLHQSVGHLTYRMEPLEILKSALSVNEYRIACSQMAEYDRVHNLDFFVNDKKNEWCKILSLNGWLLPAAPRSFKVIFPESSPFSVYRVRKILLYDPAKKEGTLIQKNYREFFKFIVKLLESWFLLEIYFTRVSKEYRKSIRNITSQKGWEKYFLKQ